jgi:hypothetical protein
MPIIASFLGPVISWFFTSRLGQLGLVSAIAFGLGHHKASIAYEAREAAQRAIVAARVEQEAKLARDIAADATARAEDDAAVSARLRAKISEFSKQEAPYEIPALPTPRFSQPDCGLLGVDRARKLRELDAAAGAYPAPPRRAGGIRKAD